MTVVQQTGRVGKPVGDLLKLPQPLLYAKHVAQCHAFCLVLLPTWDSMNHNPGKLHVCSCGYPNQALCRRALDSYGISCCFTNEALVGKTAG